MKAKIYDSSGNFIMIVSNISWPITEEEGLIINPTASMKLKKYSGQQLRAVAPEYLKAKDVIGTCMYDNDYGNVMIK